MTESADPSRYHRQMLLAGVGRSGQDRLRAGRALIVGCGALGTVIADALCRAGVGRLTIVDRDVVERTNLQRQVLFDESDAESGAPKAAAAAARLARVNGDVRIDAIIEDFNHANAERLAFGDDGVDPSVIVDGTDNFETRYLMNDLAVSRGVPYVYGGAVAWTGMTFVVLPAVADAPWTPTPCLRCVFDTPPAPGATPTCDTAGVLGPVVSMIASLQAAEALKILLGDFERVRRDLVSYDAYHNELRATDLSAARRADCPCCAERRFVWLSGERGAPATHLCGRDAVQIGASGDARLDLDALASNLSAHGRFEATPFMVRGRLENERGDEGTPIELTIFANGRAIIRGVTRVEAARAIYARFVGG